MNSIFFKRRKLIVDRFQYRLVALSMFHFGMVLMVFLLSMLLPVMLRLDDPYSSYIEKQRAADVLLFFNEQLWLPLAGVFLLLTIQSLFVSHRIAGPLYRFRKVYESVGSGDLAIRANIRKHDYLHADARALNGMIESLETTIREVEGQALHLAEDTARLKAAVGAGVQADIQKAAASVEAGAEGLKEQLACFAKKA